MRSGRRPALVGLAVAVIGAALLVSAHAADPAGGTLSPASPSVHWTGGPVVGADTGPVVDTGACNPPSCDLYVLKTTVPASQWQATGGGVVVRIAWADQNSELDLYLTDETGRTLARSIGGGVRAQQVFVAAPAAGTYQIKVFGVGAAATSYEGAATVVAGNDPAASPVTDQPMRFSAPAMVDPQLLAGEPSLTVGPDGRVYISAPAGLQTAASFLWRSDDGGRRFDRLVGQTSGPIPDPFSRLCAETAGGGDIDVAADPTGRLYFADLGAGGVSTGVSRDRGATWTCRTLAGSGINDDRPWIAAAPGADGEGPQVDAYLAYNTFSNVGQAPGGATLDPTRIQVDVSRDGGRTWTASSSFGAGLLPQPGSLFTARDGTVYEVFPAGTSVWLARSRDQGRTFAVKRVSTRSGWPGNTFVSGAVDAAGNVYTAWVDAGTYDVLISSSTDGGDHWSVPARLNPPASETAVMPWVAAGRAGDVAVGWYGTSIRTAPDAAPSTAWWDVWIARSLNGSSAAPAFRADRLTETPMHTGDICLNGVQCAGTSNRKLADFFKIAIKPDGAVIVTFNDTAPGGGPLPVSPGGPFVTVVRQVSGLGMGPFGDGGDWSGGSKAAVPETAFVSMPTASSSAGTARLTFSLRSNQDLTKALTASDDLATDAYWLLVWKGAGRVEYAGLHLDRTGATKFFGGDATSIGGYYARGNGWATYPETFSLNGHVDRSTGTVSIDVPWAMYHLAAGDVLHGLQAFSFTGRVPATVQPLHLVDSTPARSVAIR